MSTVRYHVRVTFAGTMIAMAPLLAGCVKLVADQSDAPSAVAFAAYDADSSAKGGVVIDRAPDGMFYVDAKVNGRKMRFLVDTGATVVVLTPGDARALGVRPDASSGEHIDTASGRSTMAWTTLNRVSVAGREVRSLRAAVVKNSLGTSLLGQNALAQLGTMTMSGDQLTLR